MATEILCGLTMNGRSRHFLTPAKRNTFWDVIAGTADDAMVRMRASPQAIRAIDARERERVLLTSLSDRRRFKPTDIVACYERRWQIETSYQELKPSMLSETWCPGRKPACSSMASMTCIQRAAMRCMSHGKDTSLSSI